jgi:hypothetical protein
MTNKLKINFAPGCFDNFEGTQEELDAMVAEIQSMFENMSPEDLENQSRSINLGDLLADESISDDELEQILGALIERDDRKLQ